VVFALALALAVACVTGEPADDGTLEAPAPEVVQLRFDWPAGLLIHVDAQRERTRREGDKATQEHSSARFDIRTERAADGLRVRHETVRTDGDALDARLSSLVADYVVGPRGDFIGIVDVERLHNDLRLFLEQLTRSDAPFSSVDVDAFIEQIASVPELERAAAERWSYIVGNWNGAGLELGAVYTHVEAEILPLLGQIRGQMNYAFSLRRRVPCQADGLAPSDLEARARTAQDCVEVVLRSESDAEDVQRAIEDWNAGLLPDERVHTRVDSLQIVNERLLITEPASLLPHRFEESSMRRLMGIERGEVVDMEEGERHVVRYRYPEATGKSKR
jgi:hypothetical protein